MNIGKVLRVLDVELESSVVEVQPPVPVQEETTVPVQPAQSDLVIA